jgi:hypothetical protein
VKRTHPVPTRALSRAAVILTLVTGGVLTGAPGAHASTAADAANIRACVNVDSSVCAPTTSVPRNTTVSMSCWRDAAKSTVGLYASPRWFLVRVADGREGFMHSSLVSGQTSVPNCNTLARVRMADWAIAQHGKVYANSSDAALFTASDWAPGPYGEWSGDCIKYSWTAAYRAGVSMPRGNAINVYNSYKNAGRIRGGYPAYGQPVFWNVTSYGHTQVSLGSNATIGTRGLDNNGYTVARQSVSSYSSYLGWAVAA